MATARAHLDELEWEMTAEANHFGVHLGIDRGHFLRAEAAWRDGDVDEAYRWLQHGNGFNYDWSMLELRRGQIDEARGDLEQARIHFARVVEALEPADPELAPRREEAQAKLLALLESGD